MLERYVKALLASAFSGVRRLRSGIAISTPLVVPSVIPRIVGYTDKRDINARILSAMQQTEDLRRLRKKISAVFRVKNAEDTIASSVLSFLPVSSEIIMVDNGSSDGTRKEMERLQQQLSWIVPVKLLSYENEIEMYGEGYGNRVAKSPNKSIANYYNFCISHATGDYVLKADAGCILLPFGARLILNAIASSPAVVMTTGSEVFGRRIDLEPRIFRRDLGLQYRDGDFWEYLDLVQVESDESERILWIHDPIFLHISALGLQKANAINRGSLAVTGA